MGTGVLCGPAGHARRLGHATLRHDPPIRIVNRRLRDVASAVDCELLVHISDEVARHAAHVLGDARKQRRQLVGLGVLGVEAGDAQRITALDRQARQYLARVIDLRLADEQPALASLVGAARAAQSVNVLVASGRDAELQHVRDVGEVHATRSDVGGDHDGGFGAAEAFSGTGALALVEAGMNTVDSGQPRGLAGTGHLGEKLAPEDDSVGVVEEDDGLERVGAVLAGLSLLDELQRCGDIVLEAR